MRITTKVNLLGNVLIFLGVAPLALGVAGVGYMLFTGSPVKNVNFTPDLSFLLMIFLGKELKSFNHHARKFAVILSSCYLLIAVTAVAFISLMQPSLVTGFFEVSTIAGFLVVGILFLYLILPLVCLLLLAGSRNKSDFEEAI